MIRIAFVIDTIESPTAGTEKQLLLLIKHLDRKKFIPYLCVLRVSSWLRENFRECELVDMGVPSFGRPSSYLNLFKFVTFLKAQKVDIVQTHFVDGNKVGILAGKLAGVKAIVSSRRNQGYWHNKREVLTLTVFNRWVTRFLANSENTRQWTITTEGVDSKRIDVIHNALEIERYNKGSQRECLAFKKNLGLPPDSILIGIVANLRPVKSIDTFLKAAKIVSESCPEAHFIIVGEGPERIRLEQLGVELGIASKIRLLGQRLDIPEILSCIDVGILSSKSESFSNSIIECLAAGLPVVCTDVGGAREAVEDGVNGFVVPPGDYKAMADKIVTILTLCTMAQMGQASRHKAEKLFSLSAIMQTYEQYYEKVLTS